MAHGAQISSDRALRVGWVARGGLPAGVSPGVRDAGAHLRVARGGPDIVQWARCATDAPPPMPQLPSLADITAASDLLYRHLAPTPQLRWPRLCEALGTEVWLKHENHTPVGAFKVRGGLVYFDSLRKHDPGCRGVVSATRGNHGQSVGFAARAARPSCGDLRAARQQPGEERRDARARRGVGGVRRRLPGRA